MAVKPGNDFKVEDSLHQVSFGWLHTTELINIAIAL